MAGIYIHIPFCKQACHYCDFHFSTSLKMKDQFVKALLKEIKLQKDYVKNEGIKTIYFGGGTPSLLSGDEINLIIHQLKEYYSLHSEIEITLEANPDDLTFQKLEELKKTPINRFSIGVQSFFDEDLQWMNRAHNAKQAEESIRRAQQMGFTNITIDFIYGTPTLTDQHWLLNLEAAFKLGIQHISAYSLTVEKGTALSSFIKKKKVKAPDEEQASRQFEMLMEQTRKNGFVQYEISNFAKEGFISKHNSSYWKGEKYLGIGPSAHSYNYDTRQWNVANNKIYIQSMEADKIPCEIEVLTDKQKFNEYLLTSLRTSWGCNIKFMEQHFLKEYCQNLLQKVLPFIQQNLIENNHQTLVLTNKGKLLADRITSDLFE